MTTILGLAGSLRKKSYNRAALRAAAELAPEGTTIDIGSIDDVPLYNGDVEDAEGLPASVLRLQDQLRKADGVLLVTPEYNAGMPGVFKNAIDWMSRGDGLKAFKGKPVALLGASPGGFGSILGQTNWLSVLRKLEMSPWYGATMAIARANKLVDEEGNLADPETRERLQKFVQSYADSLKK